MSPRATAVIVFALSACVGASRLRVSPELDPKSHDTFFGKDYPDDHRVQTPHHFEHPFPVVQKSDDYDKDYVKDENADGGEWSAQMEYDQLRHDIDNKKRAIDKAKKLAEGHNDDLKAAEKAEADAKAKAEAAKAKAKEAKEFEEMAKQLEDEAEKNVNDANATDMKANMTLEDCKKQLGMAKEKVEKLKSEAAASKAAADGERARKAKDGEDAEHKTVEELEAAHKKAEAAVESAEAEAAAMKKTLDELRANRTAAEKSHGEAEKSHKEVQKEIEKTEQDMKTATEKLREVRHGQVTPGGGISHEEKNQAGGHVVGALVMALVAASVAF